ncbi:hypothetical protein OIU78_027709 [Salix suchowensis]|nr:hypothetical protein OIU78_027709 [Salix suchowensis]
MFTIPLNKTVKQCDMKVYTKTNNSIAWQCFYWRANSNSIYFSYRVLQFHQSSGKPRNVFISLATGVASPDGYGRRDSTFISDIV